MSYGKEERGYGNDTKRTLSQYKAISRVTRPFSTSLIPLQMSASWLFTYLDLLQDIQHMFAYGKSTSAPSRVPSRLRKLRVFLWPCHLSNSASKMNSMPQPKN